VHGASGNLRDFTFALVPALARRFRVICMDRPGFGLSDPLPAGQITLAAQAAHLRAAAAQLGVDRPVLCGHSYGGAVALAWALEAPVAALVLLGAPSLPWPDDLDPWYRWNRHPALRAVLVTLASAWVPMAYVGRAVDGIFAPDPAPPGYADHIGRGLSLRRRTLDLNIRQINALRAQLVAMEPHYPSLRLPVELAHGTADTIVPLHIHSAKLALRLPSARLTVLDQAGHMPHHSHKDQVVAIIMNAALRAGLP
jgi:pimeloyl-ACP methyl ester carboxylesterase